MFHKQVCYFLNKKPNSKLRIDLPTFLSTPETEVGKPVSRENLCLAEVIPKALFQEKLNPNFPILCIINERKKELMSIKVLTDYQNKHEGYYYTKP